MVHWIQLGQVTWLDYENEYQQRCNQSRTCFLLGELQIFNCVYLKTSQNWFWLCWNQLTVEFSQNVDPCTLASPGKMFHSHVGKNQRFFQLCDVANKQLQTKFDWWIRKFNENLNLWKFARLPQYWWPVLYCRQHTVSPLVSKMVKLVNQKIKWLMRVLRNQKINEIQPNSHSPLQSKSIFLPVMFTKHDRGFGLGNEFIYILFPGSYFTGYETRCSIMEFRGAAGKQNAHRFDQIVPFLLCIPVNHHDGQTNVATKWRIDVHSN